MDYISNLSKGLTISGQNIQLFEASLQKNFGGIDFLKQIESPLKSSTNILQDAPQESNQLIGLIFNFHSFSELNLAIAEAILREVDEGIANKFSDLEDLADSAFYVVLFDRLVTALANNDAHGVMSAMAGFFDYAVCESSEKSMSKNNTKAAYAAHKENHQMKRDFLRWYRENHSKFKSKAACARAGKDIVPIVERVLVRWIDEYEKNIKWMGEQDYWDEQDLFDE